MKANNVRDKNTWSSIAETQLSNCERQKGLLKDYQNIDYSEKAKESQSYIAERMKTYN